MVRGPINKLVFKNTITPSTILSLFEGQWKNFVWKVKDCVVVSRLQESFWLGSMWESLEWKEELKIPSEYIPFKTSFLLCFQYLLFLFFRGKFVLLALISRLLSICASATKSRGSFNIFNRRIVFSKNPFTTSIPNKPVTFTSTSIEHLELKISLLDICIDNGQTYGYSSNCLGVLIILIRLQLSRIHWLHVGRFSPSVMRAINGEIVSLFGIFHNLSHRSLQSDIWGDWWTPTLNKQTSKPTKWLYGGVDICVKVPLGALRHQLEWPSSPWPVQSWTLERHKNYCVQYTGVIDRRSLNNILVHSKL